MSLLNVTVKKAKYCGIQAEQFKTYVTLKLQNVKSTTVTVKGSEPCWEQDFLFETTNIHCGLLIEVWCKGMIWDRALGYQYITLDEMPPDGGSQWYFLDMELVLMNGQVAGTRNPTDHMIALDCRLEALYSDAVTLQRRLELFNGHHVDVSRADRHSQYLETSQYSEDSDYTSDFNYPMGENASASQYRNADTPQRSLEVSRDNSLEDHQNAASPTSDYPEPLFYNSRPPSFARKRSLERQESLYDDYDDPVYYTPHKRLPETPRPERRLPVIKAARLLPTVAPQPPPKRRMPSIAHLTRPPEPCQPPVSLPAVPVVPEVWPEESRRLPKILPVPKLREYVEPEPLYNDLHIDYVEERQSPVRTPEAPPVDVLYEEEEELEEEEVEEEEEEEEEEELVPEPEPPSIYRSTYRIPAEDFFNEEDEYRYLEHEKEVAAAAPPATIYEIQEEMEEDMEAEEEEPEMSESELDAILKASMSPKGSAATSPRRKTHLSVQESFDEDLEAQDEVPGELSRGGSFKEDRVSLQERMKAIQEDITIQQSPRASEKGKKLTRTDTEEITTVLQGGLMARKSGVTAKQRWHWAYNKIVMQFNVSISKKEYKIIHKSSENLEKIVGVILDKQDHHFKPQLFPAVKYISFKRAL